MEKIYNEILEYVKTLDIIDTHEHLASSEALRDTDTDVLKEYLFHYFIVDLKSAGLKKEIAEKITDISKPVLERWKMVEPYWEAARNTGYGRALDISVRKLYGIDKICGSTIEKLNEMFLQSLKPGHYIFFGKVSTDPRIFKLEGF